MGTDSGSRWPLTVILAFGLATMVLGAKQALAKSGDCAGTGRNGTPPSHFCGVTCPPQHDCLLRNIGHVSIPRTPPLPPLEYENWYTCCCVPYTWFTPPEGGDPIKVYDEDNKQWDKIGGIPACDVVSFWSVDPPLATSVSCGGACDSPPHCEEIPLTGADFKCGCQ